MGVIQQDEVAVIVGEQRLRSLAALVITPAAAVAPPRLVIVAVRLLVAIGVCALPKAVDVFVVLVAVVVTADILP